MWVVIDMSDGKLQILIRVWWQNQSYGLEAPFAILLSQLIQGDYMEATQDEASNLYVTAIYK